MYTDISDVMTTKNGGMGRTMVTVYHDDTNWPIRFAFDGGSLWFTTEQAEELRKALN